MKHCRGCLKLQKLSEFSPDKKNKDGLNGKCKACVQKKKSERAAARKAGLIPTTIVTEKKCTKCPLPKPASEFYKESGNPDGLSNICKEHKEELTKKWRLENREKCNAAMRAYRSKPENYLRARLQRYGLIPDQYHKMVKDQDNKCKICLSPPPKNKDLVIDHDKVTGIVRGLLCYICNRDLHLLDKNGKLEKAAEYVKISKKETV